MSLSHFIVIGSFKNSSSFRIRTLSLKPVGPKEGPLFSKEEGEARGMGEDKLEKKKRSLMVTYKK